MPGGGHDFGTEAAAHQPTAQHLHDPRLAGSLPREDRPAGQQGVDRRGGGVAGEGAGDRLGHVDLDRVRVRVHRGDGAVGALPADHDHLPVGGGGAVIGSEQHQRILEDAVG